LFFEESTVSEAFSFRGTAFVSKGCLAATKISNSNKTTPDSKKGRTGRHQ
jgi:hypothetical protein